MTYRHNVTMPIVTTLECHSDLMLQWDIDTMVRRLNANIRSQCTKEEYSLFNITYNNKNYFYLLFKVRMDQALLKEQGNWIQRHLSFKKKKRGGGGGRGEQGELASTLDNSLEKEARTSSSPLLVCTSADEGEVDGQSALQKAAARRPSCIDNVVSVSIVPRSVRAKKASEVENAAQNTHIKTLTEEPGDIEPPTILETDYDLEKDDFADQHSNLKSTPTYV